MRAFINCAGPATVRMVSNNGPPLPMPMQVPPGHMVQQIIDENGILTNVILSSQPPGIMAPPMMVGYYVSIRRRHTQSFSESCLLRLTRSHLHECRKNSLVVRKWNVVTCRKRERARMAVVFVSSTIRASEAAALGYCIFRMLN